MPIAPDIVIVSYATGDIVADTYLLITIIEWRYTVTPLRYADMLTFSFARLRRHVYTLLLMPALLRFSPLSMPRYAAFHAPRRLRCCRFRDFRVLMPCCRRHFH